MYRCFKRLQSMTPGSLIFTDVGGQIVNNATQLKWTHVLIWLNGFYYEATLPKVRKTETILDDGLVKLKAMELVEPLFPYTDDQLALMLKYAERNLGRRYSLVGYLLPRLYGRTRGVYCSEFVSDVLRAGDVDIDKRAGYTPDILYEALTGRKP